MRDYNEEIVILIPLKQGRMFKKLVRFISYDNFKYDEKLKKEYMILEYSIEYDILNNGCTYLFQPGIKDIISNPSKTLFISYSNKRELREVYIVTEDGRFNFYKNYTLENLEEDKKTFAAKAFDNFILNLRSREKNDYISSIRVECFYDGQATIINLAVSVNGDNENFEIISLKKSLYNELHAMIMSIRYDKIMNEFNCIKDISKDIENKFKKQISSCDLKLADDFIINEFINYD